MFAHAQRSAPLCGERSLALLASIFKFFKIPTLVFPFYANLINFWVVFIYLYFYFYYTTSD